MARYFLIRHGITEGIEQGILQGATDSPLSRTGREQAQLTGEAFRSIEINDVYTSPLSRAVETASEICRVKNLDLIKCDEFQEMDFGWLEGKRNHWPLVRDKKLLIVLYLVMRLVVAMFSGESLRHFRRRVVSGWQQVKKKNNEGACVVVAHAGVLRAILTHEFGGPYLSVDRFSLHACSISEIEILPGKQARIISLNDTAHLNQVVPG